jgi:hypothetical protein
MPHSQAEIERKIMTALPVIFGKADSVDRDTYLAREAAVIDYGIAVSAPILSDETTRYQGMLLYGALLLIVLKAIGAPEFQWADLKIALDARTGYFLLAFEFAIGVMFLSKARLDYRRHEFVREKGAYCIVAMNQFQAVGQLRRRLQNFFWLEIFDLIGAHYINYSNTLNRLLGGPGDQESLKCNCLLIDVDALRESELAPDITAYEALLEWVRVEVGLAEVAVQREAEPATPGKDAGDFDAAAHRQYDKMCASYAVHLEPWLAARNRLTDAHLDEAIDSFDASPEGSRAEQLLKMLKRIVGVRSAYRSIEIIIPIAFALAAMAYFQFGPLATHRRDVPAVQASPAGSHKPLTR